MVFYLNSSQMPCHISEVVGNLSEIYDILAVTGNTRNDGYTYTATPCDLIVTTELPETDANFDSVTYSIDRVELVSTPAGDRIKVTLSA